ncbi:MAG: tetratricopeptide repeat protein [Acidobacteria bacterium]|nr:tetratricopeptide repeat protein [Acidobacteriota bacterium]
MLIYPADLDRITELYNQGLYLQAYEAARTIAPLPEWEGTAARLIAGRLAGMLGAPRLARRLHLRAWRDDKCNPEAIYYYARAIWDWRGPWRAWAFARHHDEMKDAIPELQSDWLALRAAMLGQLRDFDAADEMIRRAEKIAPENAWLWVEKSSVLEYEDRYEEALASTHQALKLRPKYRPALQASAHLLNLLDRESEARALLEEAAQYLECPAILTQLAQLQVDLGDYASARRNLELAVQFSPLLEDEMRKWLDGRRSDAAYLCGDVETAANLAEQTKHGFFEEVAKRLRESSPEMRRSLLPVGFIRQHHVTCAPATLTMISRYWNSPVEHLNIAEQICYGGTTDHSERKWGEQNGWVAREFCVSWDDTVKLIDRGVPFTLTTADPGNAHLQAIVGYDEQRGTLLIRDPYTRSLGEALAKEMIEHYRSNGPRGMALVPEERSSLLNDLDLKEAELYDQLHAIQHALANHNRDQAQEVWQKMSCEAEDHRLTLQARLALAWYDEEQTQVLACVEKLLEQFPEDANLKLQKIVCLRTLARRSERLDYLKAVCSDEKSDPLFWQQYAQELSEDARENRAALRLLHRCFRVRPIEASNFFSLANIRWSQRMFEEALDLYRLAACLKDTSEQFVQAYFIASRHLRKTQDALKFLEQRFQRFGRRSGFPARTLSWAYEQTGQSAQALEILRKGLVLRPEDGDLLLYASDAFARHGDFEQASTLLERSQGKASLTETLRGAAIVAAYRGELKESLRLWQQVLEAEPLSNDANRYVAQLIAETEDRERAIDFLRAATRRFPHSLPLHQLLVEWLSDDLPEAEKVLRHVIEIEPVNAWARRELAYKLCHQRRYEDALEEAVLGRQLEPDNPFGQCVIGTIHAELGNFPLARQAYSEAIRLSVDNEYAIGELIANSHTVDERRRSLEFIRQELMRQVTFGDGLFAYRQVARMTLSDDETVSLLRHALDARPDLWHAWSAVVHQLVDMQQLDDALRLASQSTEQFPLVPRVWLDLAYIHQVKLNQEGLIDALQHARRINPAWSTATQQLAEAYQRTGEFAKARELMEQAIAYSPLDHANYGYLAEVLWLMGEREQALERLRHALTLEPGYDWGWRALREWSQQLGKQEIAVECARELTVKRPGQARSWLVLAQTEGQSFEERLVAVEHAIELYPRLIDAHTLRAKLLTSMRRYDEARAACHPPDFDEKLPPDLRCAEACVDADRGDLPAAINQLRQLVKDEPNYFLAWNLLADWYRTTEAPAEYLEAARQMVRLVPHRSLTLGYLADAQLLNNDRESAKEALHHAMTLDPSYEFASATLFDLQIEDSDLKGAEETLNVLRQQVGGEVTTLRELKLAGKQANITRAQELFRILCLSNNPNPAFILQAIDIEMKTNWGAIVDEVLDEVLDLPDANPRAGIAWVDRRVATGQLDKCATRLGAMIVKNELWQQASIAFLDALVKAREKDRLRRFVARNRHDLWQNVQTWGNIGYALYSIGDTYSAIDWLSDWRNRDSIEPWMLWNLSLAYREKNRERESYEVSIQALSLPADDLSQSHALLASIDEMLQGNWDKAKERLQKINEPTLRDWDRNLQKIVGALCDYYQAQIAGLEKHIETINQLFLLARETGFFGGSDLLQKIFRRAVLNVAKEKDNGWFLAMTYGRLSWLSLMRSFRGQ